MYIDCGYGAILSRPKWKEDAKIRLLSKFGPKMKETFKRFYDEHGSESQDMTEEEYAPFFYEDYENPLYGWSGIIGVLVDVINENEFPDREIAFRTDVTPYGGIIYVSAEVPEDEADRETMITQKQIRSILAKYLGPILDSELDIKHLYYYET